MRWTVPAWLAFPFLTLGAVIARACLTIYAARAEILVSAAMLGGWALLTYGIALLTTPKVWPISGGLLLLSAGGWRLLWTIVSYGLYSLTREAPRGR